MSAELLLRGEPELEKIRYGHMRPKEAAEYLRENEVTVRSFSETLRSMYPGDDILTRLTVSFSEAEPGMSPDSLTRKLRNWLADKNQPQEREDIYRIVFALGLSENDLDRLLGLCTDYGIQYRDGRELTLAWCLRRGIGYMQEERLFRSLPPERQNDSISERPSLITHEIYDAFRYVETEDEFVRQYKKFLDSFGELHVRSYYYFDRYFENLVSPASMNDIEEKNYSVDTIMEKYLKLGIVFGRDRTRYSVLQKIVKKNWPNATAIKNIKNHVKDVPRKLLLLLYIVTENNMPDTSSSPEDSIADHWEAVNAILADCGMALLDPRNAFDWLILYVLSGGPDEAMSDKLEKVIRELYGDMDI